MELKPVKRLKPFTRFLMTIGELPSSYLVSMTYEEQLLWFCNFLQNTVIPTVDNNAEAVIELQEFVSNYFDNLDVQEEIDHKLDEMAESGELEEIIAAYIDLAAIFSFDTIADMAASDNLKDGSSVYCLGKDTYDDGKGGFYKIREITISDVVDGYNIVAITTTEDLIGERLPNYDINTIYGLIDTINDTTIPNAVTDLQGQIDTINNTTIPGIQSDIDTINNTTIPGIQDDISTINNTTIPGIEDDINTINNTTIPGVVNDLEAEISNLGVKKWIFIGDSYSQGYNPDGNVTGWSRLLKTKLGLDDNHCTIADFGGACFGNVNNSYLSIINGLTNDDTVTDVLIAGGYNDLVYDSTQIGTGMSNCKNAINTKFPNAKIHVAFIGGASTTNHGNIYLRYSYYVNNANNLELDFLGRTPYCLYNSSLFGTDGYHPNQAGQDKIANALYLALTNGTYNYSAFHEISLNTAGTDWYSSTFNYFRLYSCNDISYFCNYNGVIVIGNQNVIDLSSVHSTCLGQLSQTGLIGCGYSNNQSYPIGNVIFKNSSNAYYNLNCSMRIDEYGKLWLDLNPTIEDSHYNYNWGSLASVTQIQIPTFCVTIPTITL